MVVYHSCLFTIAHEKSDTFLEGAFEGRVLEAEDVYWNKNSKRRAQGNNNGLWVALGCV
jgi:hypothetical protein